MKSIAEEVLSIRADELHLPSLRVRNLRRLVKNWQKLVMSLPSELKPDGSLECMMCFEIDVLEGISG